METVRQHKVLDAYRAARDTAVLHGQRQGKANSARVSVFLLRACVVAAAVLLYAVIKGPA